MSKKKENRLIYSTINNNWTDWFVELYEEYPCENKEQLDKKEGEITREIGTLNMRIEGRTKEEWNEKNAEKMKENFKVYYKDNYEKKKEQSKEWQEKNVDMIKQQRKEYREKNAKTIKEKKKEYYEANKEKIDEKNREYRQRKKLEKQAILN